MKPLLSLLAVFACVLPAAAQVAPEKALATFKTSPGLELTLWAAEPLCVNPTCMDIDHKGRVWYSESINYRQKLRGEKKMRRPEGDCIVVLEDTKGEGKADKRTIFYQTPEIHAPLGIAILPYPDGKGQKVLVCQSPNIWVFEDKDGDLKADGPPTVLLTGFRGLDHDHGVHGIIVGPDNKLYFTVGDSGVENLQSSDKKGRKWTSNSTDCRAATVWRCDLDGKNLELIAHNFRNNYEPCVDSFGTVFLSDNDDDGQDMTRICYVMPGGNYGYHRNPKTSHWNEEHPGIVPKILRTYRGSPTGICMYEGTLLPKEYRGQILHTDAGPGRLCCYHLTPKGAGYAVEREDVVTSTDSWFRPSDVTVAPDGSVFVCDWYDPGVGGHGVGDFTKGRIYRLATKENKTTLPRVALDKVKDLLEALNSPCLAVRHMALSKIDAMNGEEVRALFTSDFMRWSTQIKSRTFWAATAPLKRTSKDEEKRPIGMAWAMMVGGDEMDRMMPMFLRMDIVGDWLLKLVAENRKMKDESIKELARTRPAQREMLLALRDVNPKNAKDWIIALAKQYDGKDRFYLAAIGIAVGAPGISKEIDARREFILADFDKHFPEWNDKVAGLIWELRPPGVIPLLQKQLADGKLTPAQRLQIVDMLAGSNDQRAYQVMLRALLAETSPEVRDRMVSIIKTNLSGTWGPHRKSEDLDTAIEELLKEPASRAAGFALIGEGFKRKWLDDAIKAAQDAKETSAVRSAALRVLGKIRDAQATVTLAAFVKDKKQPQALRIEAAQSLGGEVSWLTIGLHEVINDAKEHSFAVRQALTVAMSGEKLGSELLLDFYKKKQLAADLTGDVSRLLRNSPFPEIKKQAQSVLPAPPKLDPKQLPSIAALATRKGNLLRGEQLIAKTLKNDAACLKCHTIQGVGGNVGPDLSSIGAKASRENLLESILYPSKAINHQYDTWIVETNDGLVITGIVGQETPDLLVLRDANVKEFKIKKTDIASKKKSPISIMPDNLMLHISEDDLLDLIEYLYSLKSPPIGASSRREENKRMLGHISYAGNSYKPQDEVFRILGVSRVRHDF